MSAESKEVQDEFRPKEISLEPSDNFPKRYSIGEKVGRGYFGKVYKIIELATQKYKAAKVIKLNPCVELQLEEVLREIDVLKCLRHPNLVRIEAAFDHDKSIVIVTEFISGDQLFKYVIADDFELTERTCITFMRQIFEGLSYLHQKNIAHMDIKHENIMCNEFQVIKIIDFGWARILDPEDTEDKDYEVTKFGVSKYGAPEMLDWNHITVLSDVWSTGVLCYILLSGISPFWAESDEEQKEKITSITYEFDEEAFSPLTQDAKDFLSSIFVAKEERPTAEECLGHKWLSQDLTLSKATRLNTDRLKEFIKSN